MSQILLNQYKTLVEFLGDFLGPDYEIILFDLTNDNRASAVYNGNISGCKVGDQLSENDLEILKLKSNIGCTTLTNYPGYQKGLSYLRSSSMFIKDPEENLVGLLTINFDDSRFIDLHDRILSVAHPVGFIKEHTFHTLQNMNKYDTSSPSDFEKPQESTNVDNMLGNIYRNACRKVELPSNRLTQEERISMISALEDYGFFRLKGAVPYAAKHLQCSNASIYRYLSEVKNKK